MDGASLRHRRRAPRYGTEVLDFDGAFGLVETVAQADTQWPVVYNQASGEIRVVMGRQYEQVHVYHLSP